MADISGELADALNSMLADQACGRAGRARLVDEKTILVEFDDGEEVEIRENFWARGYRADERSRRERRWIYDEIEGVFDAAALILSAEGGKVIGDVGGESPVYDVRLSQTSLTVDGFALFLPTAIFVTRRRRRAVEGGTRLTTVGSPAGALWRERDLSPLLPKRGGKFFIPIGNSGLAVGVDILDGSLGITLPRTAPETSFDVHIPQWVSGGYLVESLRVGLVGAVDRAACEAPRTTLSIGGDLASARVFLGSRGACALASAGFSTTVACWLFRGRGDGLLISPSGDHNLPYMPAIPVWDELLEELGAESPHVVLVARGSFGMVGLDGAVIAPRGATTAGYFAAVVDLSRDEIDGDVSELQSLEFLSPYTNVTTPPPSPHSGAAVTGAGGVLWVSRLGEIVAGELFLRCGEVTFCGFGTDVGDLIASLVKMSYDLDWDPTTVDELASAAVVASLDV